MRKIGGLENFVSQQERVRFWLESAAALGWKRWILTENERSPSAKLTRKSAKKPLFTENHTTF